MSAAAGSAWRTRRALGAGPREGSSARVEQVGEPVEQDGDVLGRGDPVAILAPAGHRLGLGLARYTAEEARLLTGRRSGDIEAVLGYKGRAALIHRDDMVL